MQVQYIMLHRFTVRVYSMYTHSVHSVRYVYTHTFTLPRFVTEGSTFICIQAYCAMARCHLACTGNKVAGLSCKEAISSGQYRCRDCVHLCKTEYMQHITVGHLHYSCQGL